VAPVFTISHMSRAYLPPETARSFFDPFNLSVWRNAEEMSLILRSSGLDSRYSDYPGGARRRNGGVVVHGEFDRHLHNLNQLTHSLSPTLSHFIGSVFPSRLTQDAGRCERL